MSEVANPVPLDTESAKTRLKQFENHYGYDASYLGQLIDDSPAGYLLFSQAQAMAAYRSALPVDAHFVASITTTLEEGCGSCAQLNLKMAVEAGVDRSLLRSLLDSPEDLPGPLRDIREHTLHAVGQIEADHDRLDRLIAHFGPEAVAELAMCIAGVRMYPTMKRALGKDTECQKPTLDF